MMEAISRGKKYYPQYKQYLLKNPWAKVYISIAVRVGDKNGRYYAKGIKNFLTVKDIEYLWFRDNASSMTKASIDRIDPSGHYTLENCRFIELKENQAEGGRSERRKKKEVKV